MIMSKLQKKIVVAACIIALASGAIYGGTLIHGCIYRQRELEAKMEAERLAQQEIADAYIRLHYAFRMGVDPARVGRVTAYNIGGRFMPLPDILSSQNPFGVCIDTHLQLMLFYHRTNTLLLYETVVDYFSQEFEVDSSLRLYNNGRHPKIETFVNWMWEERRLPEVQAFLDRAWVIYMTYVMDFEDSGFIVQDFRHLSPQMLDALTRAYVDPDYVLDLTSLQQQGY